MVCSICSIRSRGVVGLARVLHVRALLVMMVVVVAQVVLRVTLRIVTAVLFVVHALQRRNLFSEIRVVAYRVVWVEGGA